MSPDRDTLVIEREPSMTPWVLWRFLRVFSEAAALLCLCMIAAVEDTRSHHWDHHSQGRSHDRSAVSETNSMCAAEMAAKRDSCQPFDATCQSHLILFVAEGVVRQARP